MTVIYNGKFQFEFCNVKPEFKKLNLTNKSIKKIWNYNCIKLQFIAHSENIHHKNLVTYDRLITEELKKYKLFW